MLLSLFTQNIVKKALSIYRESRHYMVGKSTDAFCLFKTQSIFNRNDR